jgi:branched-chain amino acid transport system substrate-binding protein
MKIVGVNGTYDFKRAPQGGLDQSNVVISRWNPWTETWSAASRPGGAPL